jgi:hypothetical protein
MAVNRWNVDIKRGAWVEAHLPRGGTTVAKVEKVSTMEGYGTRAQLANGHDVGIDDCIKVWTFPDVYATTYCNHGHRVRDGKPIAHECYVLPPDALRAEYVGQYATATELLQAAKPMKTHRGLKSEPTGMQEG